MVESGYGRRVILDTGEKGYFCIMDGRLVLDENATPDMIEQALCFHHHIKHGPFLRLINRLIRRFLPDYQGQFP